MRDVRIHDQVEIALAIADLDVLQAVPLLGQRQMTLREELERLRIDRELARAGAEQMTGDANVVAEVEQLEDAEVALRERILANVDLDALPAIGQREEAGFAKAADRRRRGRP